MTAAAVEIEEAYTDLSDPIMFTNPFPRYAELRQFAPVSRVKSQQLRRHTGYMVTRYEDVMRVYSDKVFSSDELAQGGRGSAFMMKLLPRVFRLLSDSMVMKDDPDHQRLRGLVNQAFTPRMVTGLESDIHRLVEPLLDDLARKERVDLVADFTIPLPLAVIAEMLGVEDSDRDQFHFWTKSLLEGTDVGAGVLGIIRALPMGRKMIRLFEGLVKKREAQPDEHLITGLLEASEGTDRLSEPEILGMIFLLLLAGHETTASLLGSSIPALLANPEQLERLRAEPDLIDSAIEELLRYTAPVTHGVPRIPMEDVEIAGVTIPKGSRVLGMLISANRDESIFKDPETLDLGRQPNRHIGFGFGAHYCLGNQLARLEARIGLRSLLERFEHIELAVPQNELRFKPSESLRGYRSVPIRVR
jgi:cytochrome P450